MGTIHQFERNGTWNKPPTVLLGQAPAQRLRAPEHRPSRVWLPRAVAIASGGAIIAGACGLAYVAVEVAKHTIAPAIAVAGGLVAASVGVFVWAVRR